MFEVARRHRKVLQLAFATCFYFAFACYLTWPLISHLSTTIYGGPGDAYGAISLNGALVDHHHNPFLPGTISQWAAPEGQPVAWARDLASLPNVSLQYVLTVAVGPVAGLGLYALLGYTATGAAMFLFVRRLTDNAYVALLCGWMFAFFPFAVINGIGHDDFLHGWVLVVAAWRLLELHWAPTRRNALLAAFAVALSMWWTPYFILFGGVAYFGALVASLLLAWRDRRLRAVLPAQALTAAIIVVFLALLASLSLGQSGGSLGLRTNTLANFNAYSARPLEYVIPDGQSPLFGSATAGYLASHLHGSNGSESTLYVGDITIILALIAGVALVRRNLEPRLRAATVILAAVTLVALLASAPPEGTVLGVTIPFPSHFIMKVTTTWRAYSRFVIVVMLGLTALAGIGLQQLLAGRSRRWRFTVMVAAAVLLPLDLWSRIHATTSPSVPAVYKVLAREPRGLTAEYPLVPFGYNLYLDLFYQHVHQMPIINGYLQGTLQEHRALSLATLSSPSVAPRLAALGVRYVIVNAAPNPYGLPPPGTPREGFRRIYSDGYASLYAVTARPAGPALAAVDASFSDNEPTPDGGVANWLEDSRGAIELAGNCDRCKGVLRFTLTSFARPRTVTVAAGRKVLTTRVVTTGTHFVLPITYGPTRRVTISTMPGPESQKTPITSDSRSVSVQLSGLSFSWPTGHS